MSRSSVGCGLTAVLVGLAAWVGYRWISTPGVELEVEGTHRYRFDSFAPVRSGVKVRWHVNGKDYMSAVADAIAAAEHEIFITDWQMNPHIFLKRPDKGVTSLEWRLDQLLLRKANKGVRVYILLYWETKPFINLGSHHVSSILNHPNIKICRHPDFLTILKHPTLLRWSHHEKLVVVDRSIAFVGGIDLAFGRWDTRDHDLTDNYPPHPCAVSNEECAQSGSGSGKRYQRWVGKDYGNTFLGGGRTELNKPFEDYVDRSSIPRMPWHDVSCSFTGDPVLDVARHFIQRYNHINDQNPDDHLSTDTKYETQQPLIRDPDASDVDIQVLRSVGSWSAGQPHEQSIHNAYIHAIQNAEHFIYIENQFFISSQHQGQFLDVYNEIQLALSERIVHAYYNSEDFRVIILMPLQPEFPGDWGTDSGKESVTYWNYATLYSGEDSLVSRLRKHMPVSDICHYLSVFGLRTHGVLDENFVTEIIYVHSKLMIVDDRLTIIGSANINDRSMLGDRDSEVDVIIEDTEMINSTMNGHPYSVGKFSHGLRCRLFKEHLVLFGGENPSGNIQVEDPLAKNFHIKLYEIAFYNAQLYEEVFKGRILPTNYVWTYANLEDWKTSLGYADTSPVVADLLLNEIRGRVVLFPSSFLRAELKPTVYDFLKVYVDNRNQFNQKDEDRTFVV